jgi:hypothetical protein
MITLTPPNIYILMRLMDFSLLSVTLNILTQQMIFHLSQQVVFIHIDM